MANVDHIINRLRSQMSRGQVVLFTGAGFSRSAKDRTGKDLPSSEELRDLLLSIAFPGEPPEADTTLGEAFSVALGRNRNQVRALFESRLSVAPASLPDFYATYFNVPWYRIYTLNVDDLESAVASRFTLRRAPSSVSATSANELTERRPGLARVEVVHLNGMASGEPELLTFSEPQYAERHVGVDTWYARCVADLRSKPVVYVGTLLKESTLWHHVELRKRHPHAPADVLPPGSLLVSRNIGKARAEMLTLLNVDWLEGSAESFANDVLAKLGDAPTKGFAFLETFDVDYGRAGVPLVSELATERPRLDTEYLMGDEPQWADVLSGRVAARTSDASLTQMAKDVIEGRKTKAALVVTGTAGAGKSTALMKLALQLSGEDIPVLWIDRDSRATPGAIRKKISEFDERVALFIDDADLYGSQVVSLMRDLVPANPRLLLVVGVRSNRVDAIAEPLARTREVTLLEHVAPPLSDTDITELISVLDRNNRLGVLKGASDSARRKAFSEKCGRQMLVAMIEATSGERFEEKCHHEFDGLEGLQKFIYSLLCIAMVQRHYLTRDEVFLACSGLAGDPMEHLQKLATRHLIVAVPPGFHYRARHRVIADLVFDRMQMQRQLAAPLKALVIALASKVDVNATDSRDRVGRFLARIINHGFLNGVIQLTEARDIYASVENLLADAYHYWLQRGSLEVEAGDLNRAEMALNQARSLPASDYRVDTEYGYLLMKKAIEQPTDLAAAGWMNQGTQLLEGVIAIRGTQDSYPYHILGSQGVAWASRSTRNIDEQRRLLSYSLNVVEQGLVKHPFTRDLIQLRHDIQQRILMTTVGP